MGYGTDPEQGGYGKDPEYTKAPVDTRARLDAVEPMTWYEKLLSNSGDIVSPKDQSRIRGVLTGAAAPVMGVAQGIAHAAGGGEGIDSFINEKNAQYEAERAASGRSGFDAAGAIGSMISPASIGAMKAVPYLAGASGFVPKAAQYLGNVGIGAATGAGLNVLDPVTDGQDYGQQKIDQATSGAVGGAVASGVAAPLVSLAARGVGWANDILRGRGADIKAANIYRGAAGDDLNAIRAANAAASPSDTAAQAATGVNNDVVSALGELAKRNDTSSFYSRKAAQEEMDRLALLQRAAGGANQTEARTVRDASKDSLNQITTPMRETELNAANMAGEYAPKFQAAIDEKAASKIGALQDFGAVAQQRQAEKNFRQMQLDSLEQHGLTPLDSGRLTQALQAKINDPTIGPNQFNRDALSNVGQLIREWEAKNGGVIDAKALYEIRKSAVNNIVDQQMRGAEPSAIAKRQAEVMSQVRPLIDDAIERAGGTGWIDYLKTFSDGMQAINQRKMGATALDLYKKGESGFLNLVRGDSPKLVEKNFGQNQFDLSREMGAGILPLETVASQLERNTQLANQASSGGGGLARIIADNTSKFRLPNPLNHSVALANDAISAMEGRLNKNTMNRLIEAMKSGQSANDLMDIIPTSQKQNFLKILLDSQGGRSALVAGSAAVR